MVTRLDTKLAINRVPALIEKYGRLVDFVVPSSTVHNAETGEVTVTPGTTYPIKATPPDKYDSRLINGDTVRADDSFILIKGQGLPFTPTLIMRVEFDSLKWNITHITPIYSGELIAAFQLRLRR